jgi:hypothetical protein
VISHYRFAVGSSLLLLASTVYSGELVPIVEYHVDERWQGEVNAVLVDASGEGHDAVVVDQPVRSSTDVPDGAKEGEFSLDFSGDGEGASSGSINTEEIKLLNNSAIVAAGGFTMEVWFKSSNGEGGRTASLIDYAGTEKIHFNSKLNTLEFYISDNKARVASAQALSQLTDDRWHFVKASFVVTDGTMLDPVYGDLHLTVDGVTRSERGVMLTGFGDRLRRPIGIGNHPSRFGKPGYDGVDDFDGLLFGPKVSLGADTPINWTRLSVRVLLVGAVGFAVWRASVGTFRGAQSKELP